jgi:MSHA biogenesis protein MshL
MLNISFSKSFFRQTAAIALLVALSVPLSGCDLTKNHLKADRSSDMEVQDYRDALAQREADVSDRESKSNIPEMKPYMATPSDQLRPMPLVSIAVNQTVPLRDVLYELAQQADYDLELDPRITGSIIFTARNRPFDEVIDKISTSAGLRYKLANDSVKVELDTPYQEVYKINYLSLVRKNSGSIANNVAVVSGEGADTGSNFKSETSSEIDFWKELETNLEQIINANRDAQTLRTERDPKITAISQSPAPVEPVVLTSDGELAEGGATVQVQAPQAVLQVQPLPIDENQANSGGEKKDPFASRYSINRQAGLISVFANEHLQKIVASYLEKLEKSVSSQVLIEAKVLEVGLTDEFAAGIDWGRVNGGEFDIGVRSTTRDAITGIPSVIPAFTPESSPGIGLVAGYLGNDLSITARALSRFGTVRALASPRVTVLNNQAAVLNVARNQVWFEIDADLQQGNALGQQPILSLDTTIRNVPEGVLINVQPSIDMNKQTVTMAVRPTVTRIVEYIPDPAASVFSVNSGVPVVNIQEFDSVLTLNSGQALVLGGLIQDRTDSQQNAVPVLGEVPLLGGLFRNQGDKVMKTELVVLMKATIMGGGNNIHNTDKDLYRTFSQDRRPWEM